jgi:hypothetical protein
MKFTIAILSLVCCGCWASEQVVKQKRSLGWDEGIIGSTYGLPTALDSSISSHTHTHTTSVIEKPVIVSTPTITTTKIISPAIQSTILPSSYGSYAWPSAAYGGSSYAWPSSYGKIYSNSWPSSYGKTYSNYGKFYPSFGRYYSSGLGWPSSIYSKSYYSSSPIYKYKW